MAPKNPTDALLDDLADRVLVRLDPYFERLLARTPEPERLMDRKLLAAFLGVSLPQVDRLRTEGMPCVRVGDSPRFVRADVLEWLRARER